MGSITAINGRVKIRSLSRTSKAYAGKDFSILSVFILFLEYINFIMAWVYSAMRYPDIYKAASLCTALGDSRSSPMEIIKFKKMRKNKKTKSDIMNIIVFTVFRMAIPRLRI
jgi:hypothetical protein